MYAKKDNQNINSSEDNNNSINKSEALDLGEPRILNHSLDRTGHTYIGDIHSDQDDIYKGSVD